GRGPHRFRRQRCGCEGMGLPVGRSPAHPPASGTRDGGETGGGRPQAGGERGGGTVRLPRRAQLRPDRPPGETVSLGKPLSGGLLGWFYGLTVISWVDCPCAPPIFTPTSKVFHFFGLE